MATKAFLGEFRGEKIFEIWNVDEAQKKVGQRPVISFGYNKACLILDHVASIEQFCDLVESKKG